MNQKEHPLLIDSLQEVLALADEKDCIPVRTLVHALAGRGYAALLVLLSIPFCFPITIPGFSTPFGIILAFIGFRIAFAKRPWWPKWFLEKDIPSKRLAKFLKKAVSVVQALKKALHPRLDFFVNQPYIRRFNGLLIALLAIILSLPIPIPMTNVLCALPIFCFGLGKLEDDGLAILLGYTLTFICFLFFALLFLFGKSLLNPSTP